MSDLETVPMANNLNTLIIAGGQEEYTSTYVG